jgi:hypothetical protein
MGLKAYGRGLNGPDTPRAAFHDIAEGCDAVAVLAEHFSNFAAGKLHIAMVRPWNTGPAHSPPRHRALYLHRIFESFRHVQRPKTRLQW